MATSVKLDDALKGRLQQLAGLRRRSPHWIMREAIEQYVAREEARENFGREASESWAAFQDDGLHLSGDEVRDWLTNWGSDSEAEPPDCHD